MGPLLVQMSLGGLGIVGGATTVVSPTSTTDATLPSPTGCVYATATKNFVCPAVTANGLTISRSYTLYDASGQPQSQADAVTTASIRLITTMNGTATEGSTTQSMDLLDDETLSGINTGRYTLNGLLTATIGGTITDAGSTQPFSVSETARTANLVLPPPGAPSSTARWPLSGTVTIDLTISSGAGSQATTLTAREVLTFNGTSNVSIVITIAGQSTACTWNLAGTTGPVCGMSSAVFGAASSELSRELSRSLAESLLPSPGARRPIGLVRMRAAMVRRTAGPG